MKNTLPIRETIEVVGAVSIVASLIFVGMQMNQEQAIAIAGQYQTRAQIRIDSINNSFDPATYAAAVLKVATSGVDSLTPAELFAYNQSVLADYIADDNEFFQYRAGFMEEEYYLAQKSRLLEKLKDPYVKERYVNANNTNPFSIHIRALVNEVENTEL